MHQTCESCLPCFARRAVQSPVLCKMRGAAPQARNEFRPATLIMNRAHKLAQRAVALSAGTEEADEGGDGQVHPQLIRLSVMPDLTSAARPI